jgi:hypothetical protein
MQARRFHNNSAFANQLIDNIIKAAQSCDPEAINDFFDIAVDSNIEHLNLIDKTLPVDELIKRQRAISQGAVLLALFNHFALQQRFGEVSILGA